MKRSCRISLKFLTKKKQKQINALLKAYRAAVNKFIRILWKQKGSLDKQTLDKLKGTRLSERFKSQTLKQALEIVISTKKSAKALGVKASLPVFKGQITLDAKFVEIKFGDQIQKTKNFKEIKSFDLLISIACLKRYHKVAIVSKRTKIFNKWNEFPRSRLIQGCGLSENYLTIWFDIENPAIKQNGKTLAVDIGVCKLLTDSEKNFYGTEFRKIRDKINRRKKGSKRRKEAYQERDQFINRIVNQLPWNDLQVIGVEDLKGLKTGKQENRGKSFRKAMIPWRYPLVINRIEEKSQENGVYLVRFNPRYSSRTCPECNKESEENRKGESFKCIFCGYQEDSDVVGALNGLKRTLKISKKKGYSTSS